MLSHVTSTYRRNNVGAVIVDVEQSKDVCILVL